MKTVLVTGASSGIGRSLVEHLSESYHVVAVARRHDRMVDLFGDDPSVDSYEFDLSDTDAIPAFVDDLREDVGEIPYLVNNAGVNAGDRTEETDRDAYETSFAVNVTAPALLMRAVLPDMVAADFGRIVNVTSGAGIECPTGSSAYAASKAALNALTVTTAKEHSDQNIKVNLMSPGPCRTEMAPDGALDPSVCHPTADYLLSLDESGPTGRFFWLGYEVPLFPDLGDIQWEKGVASDELRRVL